MKNIYRTVSSLLLTIGAFALTGCGTTTYLMQSEGEMFTQLTKITESPDAFAPVVGNNGGPLFFAYQANGKGQINIYKKNTPLENSMTQMTSVNSASHPTYNEVTDNIAFTMKGDIYSMSASKGKAMTQITSATNFLDDDPCFSPDGQYIIYDRITPNNGRYYYYEWLAMREIWIMNLQTGENSLIGKGKEPSFSPDGKKIVYCKYENEKSAIWVMDIDGDNQTKLTDNNTISGVEYPRFSPDGKYIIFGAYDKEDHNCDLYVMSIDGGNLTRLTTNESRDTRPYWSTDGYIYFDSDRGGKARDYNIWRFKY